MKKNIRLVLMLVLVVSLFAGAGITAGAADFRDMPAEGYWSYGALKGAVDNGLLTGYGDGSIRSSSNITRAEAAVIVNRAFGAAEEDTISFSDVTADKWYYADVQKAVHMKTFKGVDAVNFGGGDYITREQMFTVIGRAVGLSDGKSDSLASYSDAAEVSSWAVGSMAAMVKAGYISGDNGRLKPGEYITREEFAQVMSNVISQYITAAGTYGSVNTGNVLVRSGGVTLKDLTVSGDLIIGDGVGTGDVTIDNVSVTGRIVLRGAGVNSFKVIGKSSAASVTVTKTTTGGVHIDVSDEASVDVIYIDDGSDEVIVEGKVGMVSVASEGASVSLKNAEVSTVSVVAANASVTVESGTVSSVIVAYGASSATIKVAQSTKPGAASASIGTIATAAADTSIKVDSGTVSTIVAQTASSGTSISTGESAKVGVVAVASAAAVKIIGDTAGAVGIVVAEKGSTVSAVTTSGAADTSVKTLAGTITEDSTTGTVAVKSDDGSVNSTVAADTAKAESGGESGSDTSGSTGGGSTGGGSTGGGTPAKYSSISGIAYSGGNVIVTVSNGTSTTAFNAYAAVQNGTNYAALLTNGYVLCQYDAAGPFSSDDTIYISYDGHSGSTSRPSYISETTVQGQYNTAYRQRNTILNNISSVVLNYSAVGSITYSVNPSSDTYYVKADGFTFLAPASSNPETVFRNMLASAFVLNTSASPSGMIKNIYTNDPDISGAVGQAMVQYVSDSLAEPFAESVRDGSTSGNISGFVIYKTDGVNETMFQYGDNRLTLKNDLTISVSNDPATKSITIGIS